MTTLIFSRDRAMQLQATIESLFLHCEESMDITVLYKATSSLHRKQYERLRKKFREIDFQEEYDFQIQIQSIVSQFENVLFLVDDNIFIKDFSLSDITKSLRENPDAVGFSLRLGRNTVYCYTKDEKQKLPEFEVLDDGILKYNWTQSVHDFSYPMEISSSIYRSTDILPLLRNLKFDNPNTLEGCMAASRHLYSENKSRFLCYERSVVFSNPINMVQTVALNRAGNNEKNSSENLARMFEDGFEVDVDSYSGFVPESCHQEMELKLSKK